MMIKELFWMMEYQQMRGENRRGESVKVRFESCFKIFMVGLKKAMGLDFEKKERRAWIFKKVTTGLDFSN